MPASVKRGLRGGLQAALGRSIHAAAAEQGFIEPIERLERIVPDIRRQYSSYELNSPFLVEGIRALHAFQLSLACAAIRSAAGAADELTVVDIGDSAGTHLRYLRGLLEDLTLKCIGVNLDANAVERIRSHGIEALQCRAEELPSMAVDADVFLSFETLEHLTDPIRTLRGLSYNTTCDSLVITVPYVARSRVGLYHIRQRAQRAVNAEDTHIFELSPADWRLLLAHAGWRIGFERTYLQYPRHGIWRATKPLWANTERFGAHEGFWGAVLHREHSWSDLYSDW